MQIKGIDFQSFWRPLTKKRRLDSKSEEQRMKLAMLCFREGKTLKKRLNQLIFERLGVRLERAACAGCAKRKGT